MDIPIWLILFALLIIFTAVVTGMILIRNLILSKVVSIPEKLAASKLFSHPDVALSSPAPPGLNPSPVSSDQQTHPSEQPTSPSPISTGVSPEQKP